MLLGSLERLEMKRKIKLGNYLSESIASGSKEFLDAKIWSLARLCARVLTYGEVENIIHPETVEFWAEKLSQIKMNSKFYNKIQMFYLSAGRFVDNIDLDISLELGEQFYDKLDKSTVKTELAQSLKTFTTVSEQRGFEFFGEEIPVGLYIS